MTIDIFRGGIDFIKSFARQWKDRAQIDRLTGLYREVDRRAAVFQKATGLKCPDGCGRCCESPEVETTVFEFFPLARRLWARGKAEALLRELEQNQDARVCVFYQPSGGKGNCRIYPFRPLICRLRGFCARKDRYGKPQFMACSVLRKTQVLHVANAAAAVAAGLPAPVMSAYMFKVTNLNPYWGTQRFPINRALILALQRMGMTQSRMEQKSPGAGASIDAQAACPG